MRVVYRNYKRPFRASAQGIWGCAGPLCSGVCAFARRLFLGSVGPLDEQGVVGLYRAGGRWPSGHSSPNAGRDRARWKGAWGVRRRSPTPVGVGAEGA